MVLRLSGKHHDSSPRSNSFNGLKTMYSRSPLLLRLDKIIQQDRILYTLMLALKHKYQAVYKHCANVSYSAYVLAAEMGVPEEDRLHIALGGLVHDVGKLNIPSKILYKPDKLEDNERLLIERHPLVGINVIRHSKNFSTVRSCILYHHERHDGKGYCNGLGGEDIPIEARIISVCDSFDAMTSYRSYKRSLAIDEARLELLSQSNKQFDGRIVDSFLSILDEVYNVNCETAPAIPSRPFAIGAGSPAKGQDHVDWHVILDQLPNVGVVFIDQYDKIRYCNKFFAEIRKIRRESIVGTNFLDFHRPHRRPFVEKRLASIKAGEMNGWQRVMAVNSRSIENTYIKISDEQGNYYGLLMFTNDVDDREKLLKLLQTNIEQLNILVQANELLSEVRDLRNTQERFSDVVNQLIKVDNDVMIIQRYQGVKSYTLGKPDRFTDRIKQYLDDQKESILQSRERQSQVLKIQGKVLILVPLRFENNNGLIAVQIDQGVSFNSDVLELLEVICNYASSAVQNHLLFTEIKDLAIRDNLTQVYNRQYFQQMIRQLDTRNGRYAFIMIDVNRLKHVNDNLGHMAGDLIITTAARVLRQSIRHHDFVFRYGGDEFVVLLKNCGTDDVRMVSERIRSNVAGANPIPGFDLTVSIGYAMSADFRDVNEVLMAADENMYEDKQAYRERISTIHENDAAKMAAVGRTSARTEEPRA